MAQKILSWVARVKQAWGIGHVTDVLLGRATEKVVAAGHDALSTFGLLREESARPCAATSSSWWPKGFSRAKAIRIRCCG